MENGKIQQRSVTGVEPYPPRNDRLFVVRVALVGGKPFHDLFVTLRAYPVREFRIGSSDDITFHIIPPNLVRNSPVVVPNPPAV